MRKDKLNAPHPHTCSRARFAQLARLGGAKRCFAKPRLNPRGGATDQLATLDITRHSVAAFSRQSPRQPVRHYNSGIQLMAEYLCR